MLMHTFARSSLAVTILILGCGAGLTAAGDADAAVEPPNRDRDRDQDRGQPEIIICFEDEAAADTAKAADRDRAEPVDPAAIVNGNTAFAFDLYRELAQSDGNVFFSPFSLSTALSMTFAGARGETGEEMANVLHLPHWPQPRAAMLSPQNRAVHEAFGKLLRDLHAPKPDEVDDGNDKAKPGYEILLANALWGHDAETFSDDYVTLIGRHYDAPMTLVDFRRPEHAAEQINDWTNEKTRGLIPHLVNPSDVIDASLVLTNAIYFLGDWANEFDPENTRDRDFRVGPGTSVTVPMMHQQASFGYLKYDDATALVMPYGGERVSMVVLLPDEGQDTDALTAHLTAKEIARWANAPHETIQLAMPKFKMKTSSRLVHGEPILPNLGLRRATSGEADLTGIDGGKGAGGRLYISEVIHEAVIEVDERGTEAAAATGVVIGRTSIPQVINVTIDRPFVFLIVDHETNSILFMGRVVDPTA